MFSVCPDAVTFVVAPLIDGDAGNASDQTC